MLTGNGPLEIRETAGEQIVVGDVRVTPVAWSLVGQWPRWGFVWTRPAALEVERDGEIDRLPIVDITRLVQVGLLMVTVLAACGAMLRVANVRTRAKSDG